MSTHTTSQRRQTVLELFRAVDAKDIDGLLAFMAPDATQRFGNQEPLRGHEQIRAANVAFFTTIDAMRHEVTELWEWDGTVVVRLNATYTRLDGRAVTVPAVTIIRESGGLIAGYEVFADMTPVFAPG